MAKQVLRREPKKPASKKVIGNKKERISTRRDLKKLTLEENNKRKNERELSDFVLKILGVRCIFIDLDE